MGVWRTAWLIVGMVAIVGCNSGKPATTDVEKPTSDSSQVSSAAASNGAVSAGAEPANKPTGPGDPQFQQCGKETNRQGEGYDPKARDCLWQAVSEGKPVEFTTTSYTTEGDPITYTIQALAPSHGPGPRFTVLVDSKDKFGKQGQFTYTCKGIERVAYQHAPSPNSAQKYGLKFSDCTGTGDGTEVEVP